MQHWTSGTVAANGIHLHYTRTGDGRQPALVLAHGVTDDGLCWAPLAEALAPAYDVIMVDARGHGRSDAPAWGYGPLDQARDLAGVITALGLRAPVVLGHSMGAVTTLALAGLVPDLPGAILLEDPPAWWLPERSTARVEQARAIRAWIESLRGQTQEQLIAGQRAQTPHWSATELERWAAAKLCLRADLDALFDPDNIRHVDWDALLRQVRCPALLITADVERGALLNTEGVAALQALIPQLRVAHVPGAGHSIRRDQPERFLAVVRSFLEEQAR